MCIISSLPVRGGHADVAQQVERILGKDSLYATPRQLYTVCADVAQQVERILGKDEVTSSNLVISSIGLAEM